MTSNSSSELVQMKPCIFALVFLLPWTYSTSSNSFPFKFINSCGTKQNDEMCQWQWDNATHETGKHTNWKLLLCTANTFCLGDSFIDTTGPLSAILKLWQSSSVGPWTWTPVTPPDLTVKTCQTKEKEAWITFGSAVPSYTAIWVNFTSERN